MLCLLFSALLSRKRKRTRAVGGGAADERARSEEVTTGDHAATCRETTELDHGESVISSRLLLPRYRSGFLCDLTRRVASDRFLAGEAKEPNQVGKTPREGSYVDGYL